MMESILHLQVCKQFKLLDIENNIVTMLSYTKLYLSSICK